MYYYDFVIVGGGMNGVNLAAHFLQEGVPAHKIRIIDRHEAPISLWFGMTRQVGMEQVRSPIYHHLGGKKDSLDTFIATNRHGVARPYDLADPYRRPCLEVFNEYLKSIITKYQITDAFQQGHVIGAKPRQDGGFKVLLRKGENTRQATVYHANHLVLAVGYHDNRYIPA